MKYRVWDMDLGKLFGTYETEADALALVRVLAESYGADAEDLTLTCERPDGSFGDPRSGGALVAYAEGFAAKNEQIETRQDEVAASNRSAPSGYSAPLPIAAKRYSLKSSQARRGLRAPGRGSRRNTDT